MACLAQNSYPCAPAHVLGSTQLLGGLLLMCDVMCWKGDQQSPLWPQGRPDGRPVGGPSGDYRSYVGPVPLLEFFGGASISPVPPMAPQYLVEFLHVFEQESQVIQESHASNAQSVFLFPLSVGYVFQTFYTLCEKRWQA